MKYFLKTFVSMLCLSYSGLLTTACQTPIERIVVDGTFNVQDPNQDPNRLLDPNKNPPPVLSGRPQVNCSPCDTNASAPTWVWPAIGNNSKYRVRLMDDNFALGFIQLAEPTFTIPLAVAEGEYTLFVAEWFAAQAIWSDVGSISARVDRTNPLPPIDLIVPSPTSAKRPIWTWNTSEPSFKAFRVKLNSSQLDSGGLLLDSAQFQATSALPDGLHVLYVQQQDLAGNWSDKISRSVLIDTVGPLAPIVEAESGDPNTLSRFPSWVWFVGSNDGAKIFEYEVLNTSGTILIAGTTRAQKWRTPYAMSPGDYTLRVRERDLAGNWSQKGSYTIKVAASIPFLPTVSVSSYYQSNLRPVWTWLPYNLSTDGNFITELYQIRADTTEVLYTAVNDSNQPLTYVPDRNLPENYAYRLYVQEVQDMNQVLIKANAGYQDVFIDTLAPPAPLNNNTPMYINNTIPTWYWKQGGDPNTELVNAFRVVLDPDPNNMSPTWRIVHDTFFIHSPAPPYIHLTQGEHVLWVQQQDVAGNWSASLELRMNVDTVAPAKPIVVVDSNTMTQGPYWRWTSTDAQDIVRYRYRLNNADMTNPDGELAAQQVNWLDRPADAGSYTLYVSAQDRAGNWSPTGSFEYTF